MKQILANYLNIKKEKSYLKMILANIFNRFGDSIDVFIFMWIIYEISGNPLYSALMQGINMIPTIIIMPFTGVIVESIKKKQVMFVADITRALLVAFVAYAYINKLLTPVMLLVITFIISTIECFRVPAGNAILPYILSKDNYESGISLNSSISRIMELLGFGIAGVLVASSGVIFAFILDIFSFVFSAFIIVIIPVKEKIVSSTSELHYFKDLKEGFVYLKRNHLLIFICFIAFFLNVSFTPLNSFQVAYVKDVLHSGGATLSLFNTLMTVGMILGAITFPIVRKYFSLIQQAAFLAIFIFVFYSAQALFAHLDISLVITLWCLSVLQFMIGLVVGSLNTSTSVSFTTNIEPEYMARSSSIFGAIACAGIPVASIVVSVMLSFTDIIGIYWIFAVLSLVIGVMILLNRKTLENSK